jgi:RimJ/RimL family protein N-acetyltransferase
VLSDSRGRLVPITRAALDADEDIARLVDWRNRQMRWFLTQFVATAAATRRWLEADVLGKRGRLLYWVEWDGRKVGQVGWKSESDGVAELDQFIRGEAGGPADLMFMAEEALLHFLFASAGCKRVLAKVLAGNLPALELHRAMAFRISRRIPMKAVAIEGGRRLEPADDDADTYALELVLESDEYRREARHA